MMKVMAEQSCDLGQIIAADIGGTKSWMCIYEYVTDDTKSKILKPVNINVLHEHIYSSVEFKDFPALLNRFLKDIKSANALNASPINIAALCLALPGVISQGKSRLTNLNWQLDEKTLEQQFNIDHVTFVNDFQAAALGVSTLTEDDIITLNPSSEPHERTQAKGVTVVTGAGTGLGLAWMDTRYDPVELFSSEGGHCHFSPTNDEQIKLLRFLFKQYSKVSYERILSGAGLVQLYRFVNLEANNDVQVDNQEGRQVETIETTLMTKKINLLAQQGNNLAISAIRLFVEIYAAYIGNLALLYKPAGGIYIAGGIAIHIQHWMQGSDFNKCYLHMGRMRHLAERTPVYLVKNNRLGLQGAIQFVINKDNATSKRELKEKTEGDTRNFISNLDNRNSKRWEI